MAESTAVALAQRLWDAFPGRRSAYAVMKDGGDYLKQRDEFGHDRQLAQADIEQHVRGCKRVGMYLFDPESIQTKVRCAVLDLDNHDNASSWNEMVETSSRLTAELARRGATSACFRSSGGSGIHVWLTFSVPVNAERLRGFLEEVVVTAGLRSGADGGVAAGVAEIFPKQRRVDPNGYGNLVALPLSGESAPLEPDGALLPTERWAEYLAGIVPNAPEIIDQQVSTPGKPGRPRKALALTSHPMESCAFIQHCSEKATSLSEPLWFAAATNCASVEGGSELFHTLSQADPSRYDRSETDAKLAHAADAPAAHSCRAIVESGFACPHLGSSGRCDLHGGKRPADFVLSAKGRIQHIRASKVAAHVRDAEIAKVVRADLRANGRFYRTSETARVLYFESSESELYDLGSDEFTSLCNERYDINASTNTWRYIREDLKAYCIREGLITTVYQFSVYRNGVLYIDAGTNQIIRMDGETIDWVDNGTEGILFESSEMEPLTPTVLPLESHAQDVPESMIKRLLVDSLPTKYESQKLLLHTYLYSIFFDSLLPTKPIVLFNGQKGSGKTSSARALKKALFGGGADVSSGFSTGEKDAAAAIVNSYLLVADNVDGMLGWAQNLLASVSTGTEIVQRALYKNMELLRFRPRCFVVITSRDPLSLRRDDLADRLLTFDFQRPAVFTAEADRLTAIAAARPAIWAELLGSLNRIVRHLKSGKLPSHSDHRLVDWARLATAICEVLELGDMPSALDDLARARHEFMMEDNALYDGVKRWVENGKWKNPDGTPRELSTGELHRERQHTYLGQCSDVYTPGLFPIKSAQNFGKELLNNLEALRAYFDIEFRIGHARAKFVKISPKSVSIDESCDTGESLRVG